MDLSVGGELTIAEMFEFFAPRVVVAMLCGGIIGLEREIKQKSAGIKTNILICVGAAIYTGLSMLISMAFVEHGYLGDPARISAQIVSGIGFLGGGAIIQSRGMVTGLTTAATIWVVAAIGVAVGLGQMVMGVGISLLVVGTLVAVTAVETIVMGKMFKYACEIAVEGTGDQARTKVTELLSDYDLSLEDFHLAYFGEKLRIKLRYWGPKTANQKFILALWGVKGVVEVKQK